MSRALGRSSESRSKTGFVSSAANVVASILRKLVRLFSIVGIITALYAAYVFRIQAIKKYGTIIHEFDPYFQYRAAHHLLTQGWRKFFTWYDYRSWYPFGRSVGTTTYPGLQLTAVTLHGIRKWLGGRWIMSLNDICCYIPVWFGVLSTFLLAGVTFECSRSWSSAVISALIFSILPAHLIRTIGGGFDNEAISIGAMLSIFYFWIRSLRESKYSFWFGICTGLSYAYMAAVWGGFIFVHNMLSLHAVVVLLNDWYRGIYDNRVFQAYSLYFLIGTALAVCVPPVGYMPFKSMEQISGLIVWLGMIALHYSEQERVNKGIPLLSRRGVYLRLKYLSTFAIGVSTVFGGLLFKDHWLPMSPRVRSLILVHKKTGNSLVDSVAEHQPGSTEAFLRYLHHTYYLAPFGLLISFFHPFRPSSFIVLLYGVTHFFARKMFRLLILSSIPHAILSGTILGLIMDCFLDDLFSLLHQASTISDLRAITKKTQKKGKKKSVHPRAPYRINLTYWKEKWRSPLGCMFRVILLFLFLSPGMSQAKSFFFQAKEMRDRLSHTSLLFEYVRGNQTVLIDDYRDSYTFLRTRTPEDSRILAWWDYGYHITGMGNRTSLADGNTWNYEHIALIGRCLTSSVSVSHSIIRHLADYVLIWTGGGADDLAKIPWMARIGNSVYKDICPQDPTCKSYGFSPQREIHGGIEYVPKTAMKNSLVYQLYMAGRQPGVGPDPNFFFEVYRSKYGLVRIYKVLKVCQASKDWVANPENRICKTFGGRSCQGQYPPAEELQSVLRKANIITK